MVTNSQRVPRPAVTLPSSVQSASSLFQNGCSSGWFTKSPGGAGRTRGSSGIVVPSALTGTTRGRSLTRTAMSMAVTGRRTTRSLRKITFRCQLLSSGVEVISYATKLVNRQSLVRS